MTALHNAFTSGKVKGKSLADMSFGPMIYQLFAICEFLEEIIVLEFNDLCIQKLKQWMDKDADAYDWTHTLEVLINLKGSSDEWKEREDMVRSRLKRIEKCDFTKDNPTDPVVLPKVDIALSIAGLEVISADKDIYLKNLKKMSSLINEGGYLLMFVNINASYFKVEEHKYHLLNVDDDYLKKTLCDEGRITRNWKTYTMDSAPQKRYHDLDIDQYLKTYFSATSDKDILQLLVVKTIKKLHQVFSSEAICGDTLYDISYGPILYHLFPACQVFKEIKILDCNDQCIKELRKWKNKDSDAHDWSYAAQIAAEQGVASKRFQDIEDITRGKLIIEKSCLVEENPKSVIELPQADCVLSCRALDGISQDCNAFLTNLKNMSSVLKAGGHLILIGVINAYFFTVCNDKYFALKYDDVFLRKSLCDEGYTIKYYEDMSSETTEKFYDIEKYVFVVAQKQ